MKYNWKTMVLEDFIDVNPKESLSKGTIAKKIAMEKIQPFTKRVPGYELEEYKGGTKFKNGDTIMARITPCLENGKTAMVDVLNDGEVGFGSTEYIVFRGKEEISDPHFVYYLVTSPLVRDVAIKSMVGSSGRQRVQTDVIQKLEIDVPELDEQKEIASILKSIDDKIALNNDINKNLYEQAEALYKQYFAPNVANTAETRTLDQFCEIFTGRKNANASVECGKYKFFTCAPEALQIDSYIYDGPAIIVSGNGAYTGRTRYYSGCFDLYQRTYACTLKEKISPELIYPLYWFVKLELSQKISGGTRGSAIPYIVMNDLAKYTFVYDENLIMQYTPMFKYLTETIQANENENEILSQLRDALLPNLMTGKLDISEINI